MRDYEAVFILSSNLNEEGLEQMLSSLEEEIGKNAGEIKERERWGRRRLAYPIGKQREGFYYRLSFAIDEKAIVALKKIYGLNESILRTMITKK